MQSAISMFLFEEMPRLASLASSVSCQLELVVAALASRSRLVCAVVFLNFLIAWNKRDIDGSWLIEADKQRRK